MISKIETGNKHIYFSALELAKNPNQYENGLLKKVVVLNDDALYLDLISKKDIKIFNENGDICKEEILILKDKKLPKTDPARQYILFTSNVLVIDKLHIDELYFLDAGELIPLTQYADSLSYIDNMKQAREDYLLGRFGAYYFMNKKY
jgi:hypothetical protein